MVGIVADLSRDQMKALAQHFFEKPWPTIGYRVENGHIATTQSATTAAPCPQ